MSVQSMSRCKFFNSCTPVPVAAYNPSCTLGIHTLYNCQALGCKLKKCILLHFVITMYGLNTERCRSQEIKSRLFQHPPFFMCFYTTTDKGRTKKISQGCFSTHQTLLQIYVERVFCGSFHISKTSSRKLQLQKIVLYFSGLNMMAPILNDGQQAMVGAKTKNPN